MITLSTFNILVLNIQKCKPLTSFKGPKNICHESDTELPTDIYSNDHLKTKIHRIIPTNFSIFTSISYHIFINFPMKEHLLP